MAVDLKELTRNSLTEAYKDQISLIFGIFVGNLAGGMDLGEAAEHFMRGIKTAQQAFEKATVLLS